MSNSEEKKSRPVRRMADFAEGMNLMASARCVHCGVITMPYAEASINRIADFRELVDGSEEYLGNICICCFVGISPTKRIVPMENR